MVRIYSINTFEIFFEVGCLYERTTRLVSLEGMKSCSKVLRSVVTTVHFTDRN